MYVSPKSWALRTLSLEMGEALNRRGADISFLSVNDAGREGAIKFFMVYDHLASYININGQTSLGSTVLYFTHFEERVYRMRPALKRLKKILVMSEHDIPQLLAMGLSEGQIRHFPFGASDQNFNITQVQKEYDFIFSVGFRSDRSYEDRKNYIRLISVIKELSARGGTVAIMGPGWGQIGVLKNCPKIHLIECDYSDYVKHYSKAKIFVSLSNYEGGPLPVLESLLCGIPAVITNTGFAPQLWKKSTENSLKIMTLLPANVTEQEAVFACLEALKSSFSSPEEIRDFGRNYSFDRAADVILSKVLRD